MRLKRPVSALLFPDIDDESDSQAINVLTAYGSFIRSRLRTDAGSYRNASVYVAGDREKELLITLSNEKYADLSTFDPDCYALWDFADDRENLEAPSYTQYIIDVDFELLLDITAVFHFAYRREYRTLEMFDRLKKTNEHPAPQAVIGEAVRRQQEAILRLDAKLAADQFGGPFLKEFNRTSLYPIATATQ